MEKLQIAVSCKLPSFMVSYDGVCISVLILEGVKGIRLRGRVKSCMPAGWPAVRGLQNIGANAYVTTPAYALS